MVLEVVCPGDVLGKTAQAHGGSGTYVDGDSIVASLCGVVHTKPGTESGLSVLEVRAPGQAAAAPVVPEVGNVVIAKVTRINKRACTVDIVQVGEQALETPFKGSVRVQDIRASEIDKIVMEHCFRPGDLIQAEVLSLGTMREYFLTTAKNELGVVWAHSQAGFPMEPLDFEQMRCPETSQIEKRKVANPDQKKS